MTASTRGPLVDAYLVELRRAARDLPPQERRELLGDIEEHLDSTLDPAASEAEVREALDRLGDPRQIVADVGAVGLESMPNGRGPLEWSAIVLLLLGGFFIVLGWIIGVVLLWMSRAWTWKQKLIGTFVIPGGLATGFVWLFHVLNSNLETCTSIQGRKPVCTGGASRGYAAFELITLVLALVLPVLVAIYLARSARRREPS